MRKTLLGMMAALFVWAGAATAEAQSCDGYVADLTATSANGTEGVWGTAQDRAQFGVKVTGYVNTLSTITEQNIYINSINSPSSEKSVAALRVQSGTWRALSYDASGNEIWEDTGFPVLTSDWTRFEFEIDTYGSCYKVTMASCNDAFPAQQGPYGACGPVANGPTGSRTSFYGISNPNNIQAMGLYDVQWELYEIAPNCASFSGPARCASPFACEAQGETYQACPDFSPRPYCDGQPEWYAALDIPFLDMLEREMFPSAKAVSGGRPPADPYSTVKVWPSNCTGVVVGPNTVMTARHCVKDNDQINENNLWLVTETGPAASNVVVESTQIAYPLRRVELKERGVPNPSLSLGDVAFLYTHDAIPPPHVDELYDVNNATHRSTCASLLSQGYHGGSTLTECSYAPKWDDSAASGVLSPVGHCIDPIAATQSGGDSGGPLYAVGNWGGGGDYARLVGTQRGGSPYNRYEQTVLDSAVFDFWNTHKDAPADPLISNIGGGPVTLDDASIYWVQSDIANNDVPVTCSIKASTTFGSIVAAGCEMSNSRTAAPSESCFTNAVDGNGWYECIVDLDQGSSSEWFVSGMFVTLDDGTTHRASYEDLYLNGLQMAWMQHGSVTPPTPYVPTLRASTKHPAPGGEAYCGLYPGVPSSLVQTAGCIYDNGQGGENCAETRSGQWQCAITVPATATPGSSLGTIQLYSVDARDGKSYVTGINESTTLFDCGTTGQDYQHIGPGLMASVPQTQLGGEQPVYEAYIRTSANNQNSYFLLGEQAMSAATDAIMGVRFNSAGTIDALSSKAWTPGGYAYLPDTWYRIRIEAEKVTAPLPADSGSYTLKVAECGDVFTTVVSDAVTGDGVRNYTGVTHWTIGSDGSGQTIDLMHRDDSQYYTCFNTLCAWEGWECGNPSNGCGVTLSCGTCGAGEVCDSDFTCVTGPLVNYEFTSDCITDSVNAPANNGICYDGGVQFNLRDGSDGRPTAGSLSLDGTDDYMLVGPNESTYDFPGDFSVAAWIKAPPGQVPFAGIITKGESAGNGTGWSMFRDASTGSVAAHVAGSPGGGTATNSAVVFDNTWHHLAMVREGTNLNLYVDGVVGTQAGISGTTPDSTQSVLVGNYGDFNAYLAGNVDDINIYNKALTEQEVQDLYNEGSGEACNAFGPPFDLTATSTASSPTWASSAAQTPVSDTLTFETFIRSDNAQAIIGLADQPTTDFDQNAALVRLQRDTGNNYWVEAYNSGYTYDTLFNWTPDTWYKVTINVNVTAQTYTVKIGECYLPQTTIATDYSFRDVTTSTLTNFNLWRGATGTVSIAGTAELTNTTWSGVCSPLTCSDYDPDSCGNPPDGCGGPPLDCGTCTPPADVCHNYSCCEPLTCDDLGYTCGVNHSNGCGGTINCNVPSPTCTGGCGDCTGEDECQAGTCQPPSPFPSMTNSGVSNDYWCPRWDTLRTADASAGQEQMTPGQSVEYVHKTNGGWDVDDETTLRCVKATSTTVVKYDMGSDYRYGTLIENARGESPIPSTGGRTMIGGGDAHTVIRSSMWPVYRDVTQNTGGLWVDNYLDTYQNADLSPAAHADVIQVSGGCGPSWYYHNHMRGDGARDYGDNCNNTPGGYCSNAVIFVKGKWSNSPCRRTPSMIVENNLLNGGLRVSRWSDSSGRIINSAYYNNLWVSDAWYVNGGPCSHSWTASGSDGTFSIVTDPSFSPTSAEICVEHDGNNTQTDGDQAQITGECQFNEGAGEVLPQGSCVRLAPRPITTVANLALPGGDTCVQGDAACNDIDISATVSTTEPARPICTGNDDNNADCLYRTDLSGWTPDWRWRYNCGGSPANLSANPCPGNCLGGYQDGGADLWYDYPACDGLNSCTFTDVCDFQAEAIGDYVVKVYAEPGPGAGFRPSDHDEITFSITATAAATDLTVPIAVTVGGAGAAAAGALAEVMARRRRREEEEGLG